LDTLIELILKREFLNIRNMNVVQYALNSRDLRAPYSSVETVSNRGSRHSMINDFDILPDKHRQSRIFLMLSPSIDANLSSENLACQRFLNAFSIPSQSRPDLPTSNTSCYFGIFCALHLGIQHAFHWLICEMIPIWSLCLRPFPDTFWHILGYSNIFWHLLTLFEIFRHLWSIQTPSGAFEYIWQISIFSKTC
jgi:hypothetical protein